MRTTQINTRRGCERIFCGYVLSVGIENVSVVLHTKAHSKGMLSGHFTEDDNLKK